MPGDRTWHRSTVIAECRFAFAIVAPPFHWRVGRQALHLIGLASPISSIDPRNFHPIFARFMR
jgi:hypothetical protein